MIPAAPTRTRRWAQPAVAECCDSPIRAPSDDRQPDDLCRIRRVSEWALAIGLFVVNLIKLGSPCR
jgi:uncharacterized membrane protein